METDWSPVVPESAVPWMTPDLPGESPAVPWMTDTLTLTHSPPHSPSPLRQQPPARRRRLAFDENAASPQSPPRLLPFESFEVPDFRDVDFGRLAAEQEAMARRLGRVPPSVQFLTLAQERSDVAYRVESVLNNASERWPNMPIVVLHADPLPSPEKRPVVVWRSRPLPRAFPVLRAAVTDLAMHSWPTVLDAGGVASRALTRVDTISADAMGDVHFELRVVSDDDDGLIDTWRIFQGALRAPAPVVVVLLQEEPHAPLALQLATDAPSPVFGRVEMINKTMFV